MRKGAIPVPQTVALVLGVAIIAVLGYWFFFLSGRAGGEASLAFCQTKAFQFCTQTSEAEQTPAKWENFAQECQRFKDKELKVDKDYCKSLLT